MSSAVFRSPMTIIYGRDSFVSIGKETAKRGKKALIISDPVMDSLGFVSQCRNYLREEGVENVVYLGVKSEPTDVYVSEGLELLQQENCDVIISLGGGSCIDTAKAIAVVASNEGYIGDYMGMQKIAEKAPIPHLAIPTTAGTGSEVTDVTVITNTTTDVKMMIKQPSFLPAVAVVDPLLTISSPKSVTASTGIDALSHAIEAYISRRAHPMTDVIALSAMELIVRNIETAYHNGENVEAREAMSLGAMQAGLAFSNASVCLVHGMSRPIGALFNVPHGLSNAMLLPAVLEFSKEACISRLADLGRIFDERAKDLSDDESAEVAITSVKNLCSELKITNLKDWGIDSKEFEKAIDKMATDALASGSPQNNPKVPTKDEIKELYHICYNYQYETQKEYS